MKRFHAIPNNSKYVPKQFKPIRIKQVLKENARIKQVLKENGYQESIICKIFRRITNNHSLPQSQQLTQATDIQEKYKFTVRSRYQ